MMTIDIRTEDFEISSYKNINSVTVPIYSAGAADVSPMGLSQRLKYHGLLFLL
jgi:hypothetical protein